MDDNARLHLQQMIHANQVEDMTPLIRELKHSVLLKNDVTLLLQLKERYKDEPGQIVQEAMSQCTFLFTYYTDIFNKVKKDEIDLEILGRLLGVLKMIEDGKAGQHEASVEVGKLLKQIYIDSALKKSEKLDKLHPGNHSDSESSSLPPAKKITWKQYKCSQAEKD
jgi:hypothetical protein